MAADAIVIYPVRPPRSKAARALGVFSVSLLGGAILVGLLFAAMRRPAEPLPLALRVVLLVAVVGPGFLWWLAPRLFRLPRLGWLVDSRPMSLTLDEAGFTLRDGTNVQSGAWADVSRLVVFEGGSTPAGEFVLLDGSRVKVPSELVLGRLADGRRTTLLDAIDRFRPSLAQRDARRRTATAVTVGVAGLLVVIGLVGVVILYLQPG